MKVISLWLGLVNHILASVMLLPLGIIFFGNSYANAQVTSDGTTNTIVKQSGNNFNILNGIEKGNNLFHSFSNFSVPTGSSATFDLGNTPNIKTIFSRVTGGNVSNIDGLIQTLNSSNPVSLFLMNPNGIIFGQNASLNIGGSFVGTTANSIQFADGTEFSAKNLTGTPLLTISVPIGLQFGQTSASITNHANLSANQGLTLAADSVLSTAPLTAPNGTVRIQATTGDVQLQAIAARSVAIDAQEAVLVGAIDTQSATNNGGTVSIRSGKTMTVNGTINTASTAKIGNAGDVTLKAGNDLTVKSINASVGSSSGSTNGNGGIIRFESGGNLLVPSGATIETQNSPNQGIGQSGAVNIATRSMTIYGTILTNTRGKGDAGKITVQASDLIFMESKEGLPRSGFLAAVDRGAIGNANDIQITSRALNMGDVTQLLTSTFGIGNAGQIDVQTEDTISLYGRANIFSNVERGAIGNSPGINLKTGSLTAEFIDFTKVPNIFASLLGEGSGGDINIQVRNSLFLSGARIRSTVDDPGKGVGGNLNIWVGGNLYANNNTLINTRANSFGKAGNIDIHADSITLEGALPAQGFPTTVNTSTRSANNGGRITLTSRTLSLLNGAILTTNTLNSGDAGDVTINASESVLLDGLEKTDASFFGAGKRNNSTIVSASSIRSDVEGATTTGNGGNIKIQTPLLTVSNGGYISSSTGGLGNAGNIAIATNVAKFEGIGSPPIPNAIPTSSVKLDFSSGAFSLATGNGNGGNINIQAAESLSIARGAQLSVSSKGQGSAGNIMLQTDQLRLQGGILNAESSAGSQGNIRIDSNLLLMRQGSQITTNAKETANGGNITIVSPIVFGFENSDIIANAIEGRGGNIQITTQGIFGLKYRNHLTSENDITASSQFGVNGTVDITPPGIDLNAGLVALAVDIIDPSQQIAQGCATNQGSSFVATGRGGIPQNPTQEVRSDVYDGLRLRTWSDTRNLTAYRKTQALQAQISAPRETLIQATSWHRNAQGKIELVADIATANVQQPLTCAAVSKN